MSVIRRLSGFEILDSRGRPTVRATCELDGGAVGIASVPSGASTGTAEALELRDGDLRRYGGLGCRKAVANVARIGVALADRPFREQRDLDHALVELDGTPDRSKLGANALLAVSLAFCRAQAAERGIPLYGQMSAIAGDDDALLAIPRPVINLFSGGKHAGGQIPVQDLLLIPVSAGNIDEALAMTYAVYQAAVEVILPRYGMRLLRADEGGLAPPFDNVEAMLDAAVEAIFAAGFLPGRDVSLGMDVAASHFYRDGEYELGEERLSGLEMVGRLAAWVETYPLLSIEDGLAEEDWEHWPKLVERIGGHALVVGDDLLCTRADRIERAVQRGAADTLLLKVNQVGTLTDAAAARRCAIDAGWRVMASARSGETEDDWLADLAVGWGADQIKIGSITQSERLSKYNRLLTIEAETGLPLVAWPGPPSGH